jgi:hypothetical protein
MANVLKSRVACLSCDLSNVVSQHALLFPLNATSYTAPATSTAIATTVTSTTSDEKNKSSAPADNLMSAIRLWFDGKARNTYPYIVTPTRHVDTFAELRDVELWYFYWAACITVEGSLEQYLLRSFPLTSSASTGTGSGMDTKSTPTAGTTSATMNTGNDDVVDDEPSGHPLLLSGVGRIPLEYTIFRINQGNYRNLAHLHLKILCTYYITCVHPLSRHISNQKLSISDL